jgi:site-specific recombinase XerD
LKNGKPATHYLEGDEMRALRRLKRDYANDRFIFITERGGPLTRSTVNKLITRAGNEAELPFPAHPHMLRHACGYYLANKGIDTRTIQDYLGHVSITHTVRYTELSAHKFKGLWN